jgi:hypothetical protein
MGTGTGGSQVGLAERLEALGRELGEREAAHAEGLSEARARAEEIHSQLEAGLEGFRSAAVAVGAPQLVPDLSPVRTDDKHVRSCQLELSRGRHRGIVTVKSRGEVTLVGPFKAGKNEGPCRSFPLAASAEFEEALESFLVSFIEDAATP